MLLSFFEDVADDDGYIQLGLAVGLLDEELDPALRNYVRIFQPSEACDPVAHMRQNPANNLVVWHTKHLY